MKKFLLYSSILIVFGANAQLRLVKNHNGNASSNPYPRFVVNNKLIYAAINGNYDVFSTNGTTNGSSYVTDSTNGLSAHIVTNSNIPYVVLNGEAHFVASYYSQATGSYSRITKTNFATTSANAYGNLEPFTGNSFSVLNYPVVLNNEILFAPSVVLNTNATGIELYKSNGSVISLVKNISPNNAVSSNPAELTVLGTNCFFSANDGTNGRELWKTDGTNAGTSLYLDVFGGSGTSNPNQLNVLGSVLTFVASHPSLGRELFKTNGLGSLTLLKDINTSGDSNPSNCTVIDGLLYFSASNGPQPNALWVSGGTTLSTYLVSTTTANGNPRKFVKFGNEVYFVNDTYYGSELWKTDGVAGGSGTTIVKNINAAAGIGSNPDELTVYNGKLYFTADNGINGRQLWVSDGTDAGTTIITINSTGTSDISNLIVYNNEIYFAADAGVGIGKELYAYMDPTLANSSFTEANTSITVYPNPAKNRFELNSDTAIEQVEIYSIQGQLLKTFSPQSFYETDGFNSGMYIVKIKTSEGLATKTLLVE